ncbi:MAG: RluA family pseudouridine synthase [Simkaniaceae bacterium]|nr:RluA family pseudouridine synthase [Simkaniaceae bacterium]
MSTFVIEEKDTDQRLDRILPGKFPERSRAYFQFLIESGAVSVNGKSVKKRMKLTSGDQVEIDFIEPPEMTLEPEPIPLLIIYEDAHIIAIDKPLSMVVHPAPGSPSGTLVNALLHHCNLSEDPVRPGIVHRLDKDTSGLIVAAKTPQAHQNLSEQFANREVKKTYLAITVGSPRDSHIISQVGRHPIHRQKMAILQEGGKRAETYFERLKTDNHLSLVRARPVTGRTHQIRVHAKELGAPILGDPVYGPKHLNEKYHVHEQLLHSESLTFSHPTTGEEMALKTAYPERFSKFF